MNKHVRGPNLLKFRQSNCLECGRDYQMYKNDLCMPCAQEAASQESCRICSKRGVYVTSSAFVTEVCEDHLVEELDTMYVLFNQKCKSNRDLRSENKELRRDLRNKKRRIDETLEKKIKDLENTNKVTHELLSIYMN